MKIILALYTQYRFIFLVIIVAFLAGLPLLHAGLIPTHDGEYHLIRFYEFDLMLKGGSLYPRWAPDLNFSYGIPLFTYVYPLPNYVASLLHLFGTSFLDGVKLNMFFASMTGSLFCFLWTRKLWGNLGGLVATTFYTFSPYHFVDIYVRGSVGEVWALGLFPAFLWSYTSLYQTRKEYFIVLSAVFLALIILSHNILGLMFFAFALSYCTFLILQYEEKLSLALTTLYVILASLGLSAIFWIPALFETKYVTGLQIYSIKQNFPDISQLIFPSWGNDFFGSGSGNDMSVQIGLGNLIAIGLGLFILLRRKQEKFITFFVLFFLVWLGILIYLLLPQSLFFWQHLPFMDYFQFPWRFLSLVILCCAFLSGGVVTLWKGKTLSVFLITFVVATTISYTYPAYYMLRNDKYYVSRSNFIDSTNSPGNYFNTIWNQPHTSRPTQLFIPNREIFVRNIRKLSPTNNTALLTVSNPSTQIVALSFFPGWKVYDNLVPIPVRQIHGLIAFSLKKGAHHIQIQLELTSLQLIAGSISIISFLLLCVFLLKKRT